MATYDKWRQARNQLEFEKLVDSVALRDRASAYSQYCTNVLVLCKHLPYSPLVWLFLTIVGALSALYGLVVDACVQSLLRWQRWLSVDNDGTESLSGFIVWTGWCLSTCLLATTIGAIAPGSDGSGIPRMRALFAGVYQNPAAEVLSMRTFLGKSVGTAIASGSGLSVGRAGPYTHIVTIMAYSVAKLRLFRQLRVAACNLNYLRAAVACGITASFGSPIGGVLFSVEVTAKYYEIKYLWEGVISSSVCVLILKLLLTGRDPLFSQTEFSPFHMESAFDLMAFVVLGVVAGIGAGVFCRCAQEFRVLQHTVFKKLGLSGPTYKRRVLHIVFICTLASIITYPWKLMRISDREFVNQMFRYDKFQLGLGDKMADMWTQISSYPRVTLFVYIVLKFIVSIVPCGLPLSIGVFGPLVTIGSAMGRLYGETLMKYWRPMEPAATYAVVGAACFTSAATSTVSASVIFFELTGQLSHLIPVQIACIVAHFVSGMIAPSIYDILAESEGLHSMCYDLNESIMTRKFAENHMTPVNNVFTPASTYEDATMALAKDPFEEYFPIVENLQSQLLLGCIRRFDLEAAISRRNSVTLHSAFEYRNGSIASTIVELVSDTLRVEYKRRWARVEDFSPLDEQNKDETLTKARLQLGPPFQPWQYTSVPVESFPPRVGEDVNLSRVHQIAAMFMWTKVYVVRHGRLVGEINLESCLSEVKQEEPPVLLSAR